MTPYLTNMDPDTGLCSLDKELGLELNNQYATADPFPNVVIDGFLHPYIAGKMVSWFPPDLGKDNINNRSQERLKRQIIPENSGYYARLIMYGFNSLPFIKVIENITGIKGLIPDPYFLGGGFHEIKNGGHLDMHADFNHHPKMNLERRVNVLIYLNEGWKEEYGGQLELWDDGMKRCVKSIVPMMNRCVIFNTTSRSMHGNPNPVNHPQGTPRRSIALYYYTATWDDSKKAHTTLFKQRPGTKDKKDWLLKVHGLVKDWCPPAIFRRLRR